MLTFSVKPEIEEAAGDDGACNSSVMSHDFPGHRLQYFTAIILFAAVKSLFFFTVLL